MHCAVVGQPIAHSLSPAMHRAAYAQLGLDWSYDAVEIESGGLAQFVTQLDSTWRGLSVTAPLKNEAAQIAHQVDDFVKATNAANTLVFDDEIFGYNTDIPGALNALAEHQIESAQHVTILGAGATARSMVEVAKRLNAEDIVVLARRVEQAQKLSGKAFDLDHKIEHTDLLINTIPSSAIGEVNYAGAVFDVKYSPWPSPLANSSDTFISGIDLLAHQAAIQVQLMTHKEVSVELLKRAALAVLGE